MRIHLRFFRWHAYLADYPMKKKNFREFDKAGRSRRLALKKLAYQRAGGRCETCGLPLDLKSAQTHHIVPLSMGGKGLDPDNVQCLCGTCHKAIHCNPVAYAEQIRAHLGQTN